MKEVGKMRRAMNMLDIKAQLLIAVILVSATSAMSAETASQAGVPAATAATEIAVPKAEAAKKRALVTAGATEIAVPKADAARQADARKPNVETADQTTPPAVAAATEMPALRKLDAKKPHTASTWRCGWGLLPWLDSCSNGRVGLILGTAF
jgi:hypothetical protein